MQTPKNIVLLTVEQRAELKRLAELATPGPWQTDGFASVLTVEKSVPVYDWRTPLGGGKYKLLYYDHARIAHLNDGEYIENPRGKEDADYFAAIPPELTLATLAYVEALEADNARQAAALAAAEARATNFSSESAALSSRAAQADMLEQDCLAMKQRAEAAEERAQQAEARVAEMSEKLEKGWNLLHYGVAALMADDADGVVKCWEEGAKMLYLPTHRDIRPDFAPSLETPAAPVAGSSAGQPADSDYEATLWEKSFTPDERLPDDNQCVKVRLHNGSTALASCQRCGGLLPPKWIYSDWNDKRFKFHQQIEGVVRWRYLASK